MSERCICQDYVLRGLDYDIWCDGGWSDGYPNWWLSGGHKPGWALTPDDFDPPLTNSEVQEISDYARDTIIG